MLIRLFRVKVYIVFIVTNTVVNIWIYAVRIVYCRAGLAERLPLLHQSAVYSKTCVRQPPLKLTLVVDVKKWLSYKGTCHVILLAKLHDMYLYKTDNFFHINRYLKSVSKVALLHRLYCIFHFLWDH